MKAVSQDLVIASHPATAAATGPRDVWQYSLGNVVWDGAERAGRLRGDNSVRVVERRNECRHGRFECIRVLPGDGRERPGAELPDVVHLAIEGSSQQVDGADDQSRRRSGVCRSADGVGNVVRDQLRVDARDQGPDAGWVASECST